MVFKEITSDNGAAMRFTASDNNAEYVITSAMGHDLYNDYVRRFDRLPSARWYNKHFNFKRVK